MYKTSRLLLLTFLFSSLLIAGFGCKGMTTEEVAATKPVTLEYWTVFDDVDALRAQIAKYRADRPQVTVNLRQLREEELYPRLIEALAEDKGPDIVSVQNKNLRGFLSKLQPMPATAKDTTVQVVKGQVSTQTVVNTKTVNMVTMDKLDKEFVQAIQKDAVAGGKIYGLPLSMDVMAVYYNKDLMDRGGVPEPPKNWEEFQTAVKKLTRYDKQTGKILQSGAAIGTGNNVPGSDDLLYILFKQSRVDFVSKTGAPLFNTPGKGGESPSVNIMNFYTDFANSTRDTYSWNETMDNALDKFVNGSAVFFFGYNYHNPIIKARAPQLNYGILPMMQLNAEDTPANAATYWLQTVTEKSKNPDSAWNLIDYLTRSSANKAYLDATGRPTALRAYIAEQSEKPELSPFVSQVLTADNWYKGNNYDSAKKSVNDMIHEWLQPAPDPEKAGQYRQEILNRAVQKINQTM
ncbi:extracellular solute-binding protein [Patescibacteria group bacterium]|nr:extracellular solute-binding protein [Patescibacteria group bacterium]